MLGWMLLSSGVLFIGTAHSTDAKDFKGVTLASGSFEDLNLWNHWFLGPLTGPGGEHHEQRRLPFWYAHLRTHGTSDLYVHVPLGPCASIRYSAHSRVSAFRSGSWVASSAMARSPTV